MTHQPESRILVRLFVIGGAAFVLGFVLVLAGLALAFYHFRPSETGWWRFFDVLHAGIHIVIFACLGGLAAAAAAVNVADWLHYRLGMHRCHLCGRPLKGARVPCECERTQPNSC